MSGGELRPRRVFLVGCPRSGTTLLQSLLAAHRSIVSFPESHFFTHAVSWRKWRRLLGLAGPQSRKRLHDYAVEIGEPDLDALVPRFSPFLRTQARAFTRAMDEAARRRGSPVWLEKTPDHVFFIDHIRKYVADARFIHLIRHGTDVVASLYDVTRRYPDEWEGPLSLDQCIEKWTAAAGRSLAVTGRPEHVLVSYEALVDSPAREVARVCAFLDLPYTQELLERRAAAAAGVILDEPWKAMARSGLKRPADRFRELFTVEQQEYVRDRTGAVQAALAAVLGERGT